MNSLDATNNIRDNTAPAHDSIQRLDTITNYLLFAIVAIPFLISFGALKHLAAVNGMSYPLLYPLMVDGGLIIFKALALRESLRGKRDVYAWTMAITLTLISVALNIVHVPANLPHLWLARFMAALPPLVILAAFVAVSRRVEESARLEGATQTYRQLAQAIAKKRLELDTLIQTKTAELDALITQRTAELDTLAKQIERLQSEHGHLMAERETARRTASKRPRPTKSRPPNKDKQVALDTLLAFVTDNPHATLTEIGTAIGRAKSTAGAYVNELSQTGQLHKNGHGWEVRS